MKHFHVYLTAAMCFVVVPSASIADSNLAERVVNAPTEKVGKTVAAWLIILGPDYDFEVLNTAHNLHSGEPTVHVELRNRDTAVRFGINLANGDQHIYGASTHSIKLLEILGSRAWVTEAGSPETTYEVCGDGSCWRASLTHKDGFVVKATWDYQWD